MMAEYAETEVTVMTLVGALLTLATGWAYGASLLVPLLLTLALLAFYRDPPRRVLNDPRLILSPADGRVMDVETVPGDAAGQTRHLRIRIFLSVLNVHLNRCPCAATVREVRYTPGAFLNALKGEAADKNEANLLILDPRPPLPGPIHVRQIAGALARRIVCTAGPQQSLSAGQRFGMIKLGSQTEIRLPADSHWQVLVRSGDTVRGGLTVLARWNEDS